MMNPPAGGNPWPVSGRGIIDREVDRVESALPAARRYFTVTNG